MRHAALPVALFVAFTFAFASTPALAATKTVAAPSHTLVNTAPTLDATKSPTFSSVLEDAAAPSGAVGTLVSSLVDFAVPVGQVDNVTDPDAGALLGIAITATDPSLTVYYTIDGGATWTQVSGASNTNALQLPANGTTRLYAVAAANANGSFPNAITFRAWDQTTGTAGTFASTAGNGGSTQFSAATDGAALNVIAVNDAPTATNLSAPETYTEDTSLNLVDIVANDIDNATVTATLTLSNTAAGSLTTATSGAVTSTFSALTGVWTASGPIADVNTLLAGVSFVPALDFNGSFSIATGVSDGALSVNGAKSMVGTAVNDAPVLDASKSPVFASVLENAGAPSGAVGTLVSTLVDFAVPAGQVDNVTDVDAGAVTGIAVVATDPSVQVYMSSNGGTTWTAMGSVSNGATRLLAANGTNRVYVQGGVNQSGTVAAAITFRAWDRTTGSDGFLGDASVNGGTSAFSTATDVVPITITPVNVAPTATNLNAAESYTEDTALDLVDIVTADVDNATVTATLTLSNTSAGTLSTATSGAVTSTFAGGVWSAAGPIADVNTLLAGVTFTPAANFNASFTIATNVSDGVLSVSGTKTMTGIAVNDAPVLDAARSPVFASVLENAGPPSGAVGTLVSSLVDFTVPAGGLDNVSDADAGALTGVAVVANDPSVSVYFSLNGGTTWTAIGSVSDASARLLAADVDNRIYVAGGTNQSGTVSSAITFRAWDRTTGTDGTLADASTNGGATAFSAATDVVPITITFVNVAPSATNLSAAESYTEDTPLNLIDIVASDVDNATLTATLTLSSTAVGTLTTGTSGAVTSTFSAGVWTASGATANVNTLLAGVTFIPALNGSANFTIATNVTDGALSVSGTKVVTGIAVNDAPTATNLSAAQSYTEDTGLALTPIVASDVDNASVTVTLTLSNTAAGTLTTATSGVVTSTYSALTGVWSALGPIANVNTLLAGVTFIPVLNFNSNFTIATSVSDGALSVGGTKVMTGIAVNDAPTATNLSTPESYTEDTALNLVDIVASDIDNASLTATLTLSNTAAGTLSTATSGVVTSTYTAGTGIWTASGPVANVNALLAGVSFVPAADFNGNFTIATNVSDGALSVSGTKVLTGHPVNDAPVLDASRSPQFAAVLENAGAPSGAVGSLVSSLIDFTVPAGGLDNVSDPDAGAQLGLAVVATDPSVNVFYSLDGGTTWTVMGAVSNASARLLAANATNRIYVQGGLNQSGDVAAAITFRAWDRTSGTDGAVADASTNGAATAFSAATDAAAITITFVNVAPSATNLSAAESYTEDTPLNLTDIVAADVDNASLSATLTLSNPAVGALSTATSGAVTSTYSAATGVWSASGATANVNALLAGLTFVPATNVNASFSISTLVSDGALSVSGTKHITGIAVNDAPVLTNAVLDPIVRNTFNPPGQLISSLFAGKFSDVDVNSSMSGIAVVIDAADPVAEGAWQFSSDNGAHWAFMGGVGDDSTAEVLSPSTLLRFAPAPSYAGSPTPLVVRALDDTYTGAFSNTAGAGFRARFDTSAPGGASPIAAATTNITTLVTLPAGVLPGVPTAFALHAWPVPTRGALTVRFDLPVAAHARIELLDLQGRHVAQLAEGNYTAGRYEVGWSGVGGNGRPSPGVYLARFTARGFSTVQRVVITR